MPAPSLWQRLRPARIVQVLLVYPDASWVVLQIADVLTGARDGREALVHLGGSARRGPWAP